MSTVTQTLRVAVRARRRLAVQQFAAHAGRAIALGTLAGSVLVLADRLVGEGLSREWCWGIVGAGAAAGLGICVVRTLIGRRGTVSAALALDRAVGSDERLSSALALWERSDPSPFAVLAFGEAEAAAARVHPGKALPIVWGRWWWGAALVMAAGAALAWMPAQRLLVDKAKEAAIVAKAAATSDAVKSIESVQEQLRIAQEERAGAAPLEPPPGAIQEQATVAERLQTLEKLKQQLATGAVSPDDAQAQAAGELQKHADAEQRKAEDQLATAEASRSILKELDATKASPKSSDVPQAGPTDAARALAESVRSGDLEQAAEQAQALADQEPQLSERERADAARKLEELARQIRELDEKRNAQKQSVPADAARPQQGIPPEEARRLADEPDPKKVQQELEARGVDPDTARRMSEQFERERRDRQSRDQAQKQTQSLSDWLKRAAEQLQRKPEPPPAPPPATPPQPLKDGQRQPQENPGGDATKPEQSQKQTGADKQTAEKKPSQGSPAPNQERPGDKGAGEQSKQSSPDPNKQTQGDRGPKPSDSPSSNKGDGQGKSAQPRPGEEGKNSQPRDGQGGQQEGENEKQVQPGQQQQQSSGGKPTDAIPRPREGTQPQPGASGKEQSPSTPGQQPQAAKELRDSQAKPGSDAKGSPKDQPSTRSDSAQRREPSPKDQGNSEQSQGEEGKPSSDREPGVKQHDSQQPNQDQSQKDRPDASSRKPPDPSAIKKLAEQLKKMGDAPGQAREAMKNSQQMREQAEKMIRSMSPELRKELEQLAREYAREHGKDATSGDDGKMPGGGSPRPDKPGSGGDGPVDPTNSLAGNGQIGGRGKGAHPDDAANGAFGKSEPVDLRPDRKTAAGPGQAVGHLDTPNPPGRGGAGRDTSPAGAASATPQPATAGQALQSAQRAMESKEVPARYRNIERYFKKAVERENAAKPGATPTGPAPDAPDAGKGPAPKP